uniref:Vacuolar import and degradation protein 21 n=2 Tax=Kalmanozyma brasiliensis (strain GHG001) TaxID=1365824 RepID=V5ERZ9_KALBG
MVGKADKCLMTSDWKVAFNEQRFVRAMARIEKLKAQGEWSFRQPKKQKGPVVRKAHWDHLLEEMKWLQTDFREERRWKMTVAFHLAHEVAAWHRARTAAERAAFCVSIQRPHRRRTVSDHAEQHAASQETADGLESSGASVGAVADSIDDEEMPDEAAAKDAQGDLKSAINSKKAAAGQTELSGDADVTMEAEGDAQEAVAKAVEDAVQVTDEAANARVEEPDADGEDDDADADADDVEAATAALVSGEPSKPPRVEIVREPLAPLQQMPALSAGAPSTATSGVPTDLASRDAQPSDTNLANALRSEQKDAESTLTAELPPQLLATLRAPVFSTSVTTTVVSPAALLESLDPEAAAALLGIELGDLSNAADLLEPGSLSFSKMFPELPLYGGVTLPDANSKSDRRWDEGSLNQPPRLTHVTKLLDSRPLLVSTLEPSKNRANGRWLPDSDWVVAAEQSDPLRGVADGVDAGLPPLPGSLLFARKSNRAAKETNTPTTTTPAEPSQPDVRAAMFMWTPDEDSYLMTLAKQYQNNWALVADLFNSTRLSTATDKREPWDCFDRCKRIEQAAAEGKPPPAPPQLPPAAAETDKDGKKGDGKDADASSKRDKMTKKLGSKYDGSKRKLRRSNLMEVMRKSAKRREASKQAQQTQQTKKVNLNTHETHAQIKAGPAITPQSLSALKTERDQAALRQYYEQQRAQLAYQQQQQQQQRLLAQQAQAQRMAGQPSAGGTPGPTATPAAQAGKAGTATPAAGANGAANLTLPVGSAAGSQPGQAAQAQQKAAVGQMQVPQAAQPTPQQQPPTAQMQQQQPTQQQQQQQQQVQAQLQSQLQASQAAQMQNLYAQIQQQQRQQQQNAQLGQVAGMAQVRPAVGPLTQQQLSTLTPQQQQQYHAQLAAATAAAQQQQQVQLRNQMAAVAAAQGGQGGAFQLPNAQFQLMQQQSAMAAQGRPLMPNQAQAQAAALQLYQQQQRQAAQVQAQAQMRPPASGQQQFTARPGNGTRPPPTPTPAGQTKTPTGTASPSMPATIQALQQQLAISLATSNLSQEQINGLAVQLYKQAQSQQQGGSPSARPAQRPPQQILNQAIQALAAQNQKSQQQAAGAAQARPPTPRPT